MTTVSTLVTIWTQRRLMSRAQFKLEMSLNFDLWIKEIQNWWLDKTYRPWLSESNNPKLWTKFSISTAKTAPTSNLPHTTWTELESWWVTTTRAKRTLPGNAKQPKTETNACNWPHNKSQMISQYLQLQLPTPCSRTPKTKEALTRATDSHKTTC